MFPAARLVANAMVRRTGRFLVRLHVSEAIGLLIAALGLTVMVGWLLQIPALVQISPSFIAMVFNTALCFALIGIGLTVRSTAIRRVIAVCVALFATLIWLQDVLRVDLRLDELFVRGFLPDPNAFPGRMAPQTCICFVLCSLALFALTLPYRRGLALAMQALTVVVGVAGLLSLIGYSLQLELIYGWYRYTRMAVHTAAGFAVLAAGMWFAWYRAAARAGVFARREDERISLMGGALLIIVAVTAGVSGFALLARHTERIAMQALSLELDGQLRTLRLVLMERRDDVGALARNPVLRASLTSSAPDRVQLEQWVRSSVVGTTTFLAVYSPEGLLLVRAGDTWNAPSVALPLSGNAQLLWRYGARVRIRSPIVDSRGGRIGELEAEVAVPLIAELIRSTASVSRSADLRICGPRGADSLQCLPTRLDPRPAMSAPRFIRGIELPTSLALRGERGARVFLNYRERPSVGAYARLDDEQLALVVQQETDDMYAAIRSPLQVLLVLLVGLVVAAMLLLRWQIAPLVRRTFAAKAEAAANAARLTAIMNSVPDGIISIDTRGLIAQVNPAVNALFGYSAEELLGQPIKLLIPHALAGANAAAFARFVESGDRAIVGCEAFEAQGVRKDGTQFVMQISLSEMTVEGSSFAVGVLRDITERKASERVKDEFISVVSHELRTPLTSISGSLGLVAAGVGGQLPPKANRLVQIASQNSERLTRLINDILDLEKANGGKLEIKIAEYPLRALVEQVVETNQPYAHRLGVELLVEPDSADGRVIVDRDRFVQVLTNIVSNAAKFSPAGEAVRVRVVALTGGAMRVDVSDRGSGIPESFRPRLFEKFAQADSSDTRAKGGTGLGLSIAKSLIESMGGSIGYESSSSGTTFHLTVPGVPGATLHENVA